MWLRVWVWLIRFCCELDWIRFFIRLLMVGFLRLMKLWLLVLLVLLEC